MRPYVSIFGPVQIERFVYAERKGQAIAFVELDARLALPDSKFSYLLQDWDQSFVMEQPCGVFVESGDGKGVPIRRPADAKPIENHRHRSGPRPDRKKMATVGAVYSIDPFFRTAEEIVESLFRDPEEERPKLDRPRPCHKHLRAMLTHENGDEGEINGRAAVFGGIADEMAQRNGQGQKPIVCIMDGEESLWEARDVFQEHIPMVDVLDLLHVTPRLWDAAALFYERKSAAAETFVRDRVFRILRGEGSAVVRGLRRMGTVHELKGKKQADLKRICGYFEKNAHRMRYHEYLKQGYPIASGVIEGACRHVVKPCDVLDFAKSYIRQFIWDSIPARTSDGWSFSLGNLADSSCLFAFASQSSGQSSCRFFRRASVFTASDSPAFIASATFNSVGDNIWSCQDDDLASGADGDAALHGSHEGNGNGAGTCVAHC
jgi:hypothetical protein